MTVIKHGGARPKQRPDDARGGPRPISGALKNRFVIENPFAHSERGKTISEVAITIQRCNSCGATEWGVTDESLKSPGSLDSTPIDNTESYPLIHRADCPMKEKWR
jgi:hypothetical protein